MTDKHPINENKKYSGLGIAIIVPTKDRPQKLRNLLESLANQTVDCGRIIVVDSGQDNGNLVGSFGGMIPVEYHRSSVQGQIYQRNFGIGLLDDSTPLVCSLDDDIVVEPGAFKAMIDFWNRCESSTAGVSFNIVNLPPFKHTWLKSIMGMSSPQQGRVLSSGYNVFISPVKKNIRTQWLCGGATVWKKEVLDEFVNKEVLSKWAICEDVIFSYPIGKKYPLYVCADARVRHEHVYDHTTKMKHRYYGRTITLWRLYFVESHAELSRIFYLWMLLGQIIARCISGLILFRMSDIQYAVGQIEGVKIGLSALFQGANLWPFLNEDSVNNEQ